MQPLPLAHGFLAANDYGVGVVNNSVADGISQQWVRQLFWSARDVKLGTEDRGVSLVPGLHDFQLFRPIGTQCVMGVQSVRAKARRKLKCMSLRRAILHKASVKRGHE